NWLSDLLDGFEQVQRIEEFTGLALDDNSTPRSVERDADGRPKFEVHSVRPARRVGPDGQLTIDLVVEITQRRKAYFDAKIQKAADHEGPPTGTPADFLFRGGCTMLVDMETARARYLIRKNIKAGDRLERQRGLLDGPAEQSLRATYFGRPGLGDE